MSAFFAVVEVLISASSVAYDWIAWRGWRKFCQSAPEPGNPPPLPPVSFLRPIKPRLRDLRGKLELLARETLPADQLVLGVSDPASREIARTFQQAHPARAIVVIEAAAGAAWNPKINKLMPMSAAAVHPLWIVTDSESLPEPGWFARFRAAWIVSGADAFTAGYRFTGARTFPEQLDQAATLLTLWPGLALLAARPLRFTLGACTGVRRENVEALGGWEMLGDFLAEDHRLGVLLTAAGHQVRLHREPLTLESDPLSARDYARHQHRVARTYRLCAPAGFAGQLATHGIPFSLAFALSAPGENWRWLLALLVFTSRWQASAALGKALRFPASRPPWILLAASFAETFFWAASWLPLPVWWGAERSSLSRGGRRRQRP